MTRLLRGATTAQIKRASRAQLDIRQRHLTEWCSAGSEAGR